MRVGRQDLPIVELERPNDCVVLGCPDGVHLSAVVFPGYVWGGVPAWRVVPGEGDGAGVGRDLFRVTAERLVRRAAACAVAGTTLRLARAEDALLRALRRLLDRSDHWPEWSERTWRIAALGRIDVQAEVRAGRRRTLAAAGRRAARWVARSVRDPRRVAAAVVQLRFFEGGRTWLDRTVAEPFRRRADPATALRFALPVFGALVNGPGSRRLRLARTGRSLRALTPRGTFELIANDFDDGPE